MTISARGRKGRTSEPDPDLAVSEDELVPHWVPRFAPASSLVDNVFSIARPLWGKARAEWTMWLADDLVAELPDADRADRREWAAAILWAAALDTGMDHDQRLWAHIVEDITTATAVLAECAQGQFDQLRELGLARPRHAPPWWRDDEPVSDPPEAAAGRPSDDRIMTPTYRPTLITFADKGSRGGG